MVNLIQTGLESALLTGFGFLRMVEETVTGGLRDLESGFQELAFQGSCDHSDVAEDLRTRLDLFLTSLTGMGRGYLKLA